MDNVEEVVDKIIANGGSQLGEIVKTEIQGVGCLMVVYTRDIDNNIVESQNWRN